MFVNSLSVKDFGAVIQKLTRKIDLSAEEAYGVFRDMLLNTQPELHQGALLGALVTKGETTEEIFGAWKAIMEFDTECINKDGCTKVLFENSGTGMDQLKTFNISSAAAIVAASCGVTIARHGARAISSSCGTVDIMEELGVHVDCPVSCVEKSIHDAGIGLFNGMSAHIHPGGLGRILSQIRFGSTLNIAASLANPASPSFGLRGVYKKEMLESTACIMRKIGYERGLVVYGTDHQSGLGMDEFSPCGETFVVEFNKNQLLHYSVTPDVLGIKKHSFESIRSSGDKFIEAKKIIHILKGQYSSDCTDTVAVNAGAILYIAGLVDSLKKGTEVSLQCIHSGKAFDKLHTWVSTQNGGKTEGIARFEKLVQNI
jgi:anthranilate phosphoribosyltransferase